MKIQVSCPTVTIYVHMALTKYYIAVSGVKRLNLCLQPGPFHLLRRIQLHLPDRYFWLSSECLYQALIAPSQPVRRGLIE